MFLSTKDFSSFQGTYKNQKWVLPKMVSFERLFLAIYDLNCSFCPVLSFDDLLSLICQIRRFLSKLSYTNSLNLLNASIILILIWFIIMNCSVRKLLRFSKFLLLPLHALLHVLRSIVSYMFCISPTKILQV